jgi:predicted RNA binding protein YcfA (HicA-like mRNA interferase family)
LTIRNITWYDEDGGKGMTAKELKRKLISEGWKITQGGRHELAIHPERPEVQIPIHRHTGDIPTGTLHKILKDSGLKK